MKWKGKHWVERGRGGWCNWCSSEESNNTSIKASRTDWPPLDKILPQDMTAATGQIQKSSRSEVKPGWAGLLVVGTFKQKPDALCPSCTREAPNTASYWLSWRRAAPSVDPMSRRTREGARRRMRISIRVLFSRSAERSELLIESEARSADSLEARSAESRSDDAPNAGAAQADANLDQFFFNIFIHLFTYLFIYLFGCVNGS